MRKMGYVQSSIWSTLGDFPKLTMSAQHLYLLLITQPDVTSLGTLAWAPQRWAALSRTQSVKGVEKAAVELEEERYILVDRGTAEVWIRTFIKHNSVLQSPKMLRNAQELFTTVVSASIRNGIWRESPEHFPQTPMENRGVMGKTDTPPDTLSDTLSAKSSGGIRHARAGALGVDRDRDRDKTLLSSSPIERILDAYREHHPRFAATPTRRALVTRRLRDFDEQTLIDAINGNHLDPWCNGENPNHRQYHALELILRDAEKIEKYAALAHTGANGNGKRVPTAEEQRRAAEAAEEFDRLRRAATPEPVPEHEELPY